VTGFRTLRLPAVRTETAPDGSEVRKLLALGGGGMARFDLAPGKTSRAVAHRTVDEIWLFVAGRGEMWRRRGDQEEVVAVGTDVCVTIPAGTHFQFRSLGEAALVAIGVTMPPWPGEGEAVPVLGRWKPS
jgi:mannose-6-phosphate isomerase-like protein (cupin superfamily)